jgi:hypothetical protein
MLEMAIAFIVGVVCGRALDWYQGAETTRENQAETEAAGEDIPVTDAKSE